jgi:hypothetical protein
MDEDWRDPDDIADDLASGDAGRIRVGIAGLREFTKAGDEVDLPALEPWVLAPFGEFPPEQTVTDLARLLASYRSFVPAPSSEHVVRQLLELAIRYAVPQVLYETSIHIQGRADPPAAATDAVAHLRARGLRGEREVGAATTLVGYLLGAKEPVRRAVAAAISRWPAGEPWEAIATAVRPLVDPGQDAVPGSATWRLPRVRFEDLAVDRTERYSIGIERESGRCFLSIPATNRMIDYSEYYEISAADLERYRSEPASALPFVVRCRERWEDPRLFYQPSTRRGGAT